MASYTDIAPKFSPYVAHQDTDLMLKVGIAKQAQYQQGYEKIQSSIDQVAGLDIYRDVDRNHLQNKLNELGNKTMAMAAGDFSNFQLVNTMTGLSKQIANDPYVQEGVLSTARLRQQQEYRAELEKKGKTDANNDAYFAKDVNAYLNNPNLTNEDGTPVSFNSQYVPFTNIIGKMKEALTNAGQDSTIAEHIFVMDENNKPIVGRDGKLVYADAKLIEKLTTNKEAVMAAINTVFDQGDVKQQLMVDGYVNYGSIPVENILSEYTSDYERDAGVLDKRIETISALGLSTNITKEQKELVNEAIIELEKTKATGKSNYASLVSLSQTNPEAFKQLAYSNNYKENIARMFLKKEESETYGTNEALQQQNYRQDYAFKEKVQANTVAHQNATLNISRQQLLLDQLKFSAEYKQDPATGEWYKVDYGDDDSSGNRSGTGKKGKKIINPDDRGFEGGISGEAPEAQTRMKELISDLSAIKNKDAYKLYADLTRQIAKNPNLSDAKILEIADSWAKKTGVTREQWIDRWATNIFNKYDEAGLIPPPSVTENYVKYNTSKANFTNKLNVSTKVQEQAMAQSGLGNYLDQIDRTVAGRQFVNDNGKRIVLSASDMVGIVDFWENDNNVFSEKNYSKLNNKQREYVDWINDQNMFGRASAIRKDISDYKKEYGEFKKGWKTYETELDKNIEEFIPYKTTKSMPIDMSKPEIAKTASDVVTAYLDSGDVSIEGDATKQDIVNALAKGTDLKMSWQASVPYAENQEWTGKLTIHDGTNTFVLNDLKTKNLEILTNVKLGAYKSTPIEDSIRLNKRTNSTNSAKFVTEPDAWMTAYYKGNMYSEQIKQSGFVLRGDVFPFQGGFRLATYVKAVGEKDWNVIYGDTIFPDEYTADRAFLNITPNQVQGLYTKLLSQTKK